MRCIRVLRCSSAILGVVATWFVAAPAFSVDRPYVAGELIVGFHEATPANAQAALHTSLGAERTRLICRGKMTVVTFDSGVALADRETRYLADPSVEFVDRNWIGEGGVMPNDTRYGQQWHHNNTGQSGGSAGADLESQSGWDLSRGSSSVVVAVLDSGIDSDHPEFAGRLVSGWDFVNEDSDPEDDQSHGTYCSGLLAANADNMFAVAGVDHFCKIMPVKVLNQFNSGTTTDLLEGIDFAVMNGADVLSMSLINYSSGPGSALHIALRNSKQAGLINVACAGNGGIGDADVSGPGSTNNSIAIGATTNTDARASFSGTGNALEFVAPGNNVHTVLYDSGADGSVGFSGCSAATPVAAGIVSILRGLEPQLRMRTMRDILEASAEDQVGLPGEDTPGWDSFMGYGRLNLRAAIQTWLNQTGAPEVYAADDIALGLEASPNPTSSGTTVRYSLPAPSWVRVSVFDVAGRVVQVLEDGVRTEGSHSVHWDGRAGDREAAPGIYFARLEAGGHHEVRKITRLR